MTTSTTAEHAEDRATRRRLALVVVTPGFLSTPPTAMLTLAFAIYGLVLIPFLDFGQTVGSARSPRSG